MSSESPTIQTMQQVQRFHWKDVCPNGERLHIAKLINQQEDSWKLHDHDFYECFLIEGGHGFHVGPNSSKPLSVCEMYFVRPEHIHGFKNKSKGDFPKFTNLAIEASTTTAFLKRNEDTILSRYWDGSSQEPQHLTLTPGQFHEVKQLFREVAVGGRTNVDAEWCLSSITRLLEPGGLQIVGEHTPLWLKESLYQFRQPQNLRGGMNRFVELCQRSPEHIARVMKAHLGKKPVEWINEQKLKYAANLLQSTDLSVTEIAMECGLDNLSHFHRCFKNSYQTTPRQYRLNHQEVV